MSDETYGDTLECPHCHKKDYDCWELSREMDETGKHDCLFCDKEFIWEKSTSVTWRGRI
jgi:hypothetical protein